MSRSAREHELQTSAMASLAKAGKIVFVHNYHGKPMERSLYIVQIYTVDYVSRMTLKF